MLKTDMGVADWKEVIGNPEVEVVNITAHLEL